MKIRKFFWFVRMIRLIPPIALVLAFGFLVGIFYANKSGVSFHFGQNMSPGIVSAACGEGWNYPELIDGNLKKFIQGRLKKFDCADLPTSNMLEGPLPFTISHNYLYALVVWIWKLFGVDYKYLGGLSATMAALYAAGLFMLSREFFSKWLSAIGVAVLLLSPVASFYFLHIRDFSKAIFIIWGIYFAVKLYKETHLSRILIWGGCIGLTAGLGTGFRADPLLVLVIAFPVALFCFDRKLLVRRVAGFFLAFIVFWIATLPLQSDKNSGSISGVYVFQGLSDGFQDKLGLSKSTYGLGWKYSDELALSAIAASGRNRISDWDQTESLIAQKRGYSQALTLSTGYVLDFAPLFLADFAARAIKSVMLIVAMPGQTRLEGFLPRKGTPVTKLLRGIYEAIPLSVWLIICWAGFWAFSYQIIANDRKSGWPILFLFLGFAATAGLQFAARHAFHLEFLSVFALLALAPFVSNRSEKRNIDIVALISLPVLLATIVGIYFALVVIQTNRLVNQFDQLLALDRELVGKGELKTKGSLLLPISVPDKYAALVSSHADSMTKELPWRGYHWDVRASADRFLLAMNGCSSAEYSININYEKQKSTWQPFDHSFKVEIDRANSDKPLPTYFVFPGFYRPTQHIQSVEVTSKNSQCKINLYRLKPGTKLPSIFYGVLPHDWKNRWYYYQLFNW